MSRGVALGALLLAAPALAPLAPLGAQEPVPTDTAAPAPAPTGPGETATSAAPAPPARRPPARVTLSITGGTLGSADIQSQPLLARRTEADGTVAESLLRRTVSAEGGYHLQASLLLSLGPAWAVRVGAGRGWATVETGLAGEDEGLLAEARGLPLADGGSLDLLSAEAALRFRLPVGRSFGPYAELGAAAERWALASTADPAASGFEPLLDPVTRVGAHVAVGALFPLTEWLDGRIQLGTHIVRTPLPPAEAGLPVAGGDSLQLTLAAPASAPFADHAVEVTRLVRLEAGFSVRLGTVGRAEPGGAEPTDPAGSGAAPSGTRR